jgi:hypothetical protein
MGVMRSEELAYVAVQARQGELFLGLYDGMRELPAGGVPVLNPQYGGDDPIARRFSQLEVDHT